LTTNIDTLVLVVWELRSDEANAGRVRRKTVVVVVVVVVVVIVMVATSRGRRGTSQTTTGARERCYGSFASARRPKTGGAPGETLIFPRHAFVVRRVVE
jgi:hypothetical protein